MGAQAVSYSNSRFSISNYTFIKNHQQYPAQFLLDPLTRIQYLLITVPIYSKNRNNQTILKLRQELKSSSLPTLIEYQIQTINICVEQCILKLLFQHPSKNLKQQIKSRLGYQKGFRQGQIWRIAVSCLKVLKRLINKCGYHIKPTIQNIYINKNGQITFSDIEKFCGDLKYLFFIQKDNKQANNKMVLEYLSIVLSHIVNFSANMGCRFSYILLTYIRLLKVNIFQTIQEALLHAEAFIKMKKSDKQYDLHAYLESHHIIPLNLSSVSSIFNSQNYFRSSSDISCEIELSKLSYSVQTNYKNDQMPQVNYFNSQQQGQWAIESPIPHPLQLVQIDNMSSSFVSKEIFRDEPNQKKNNCYQNQLMKKKRENNIYPEKQRKLFIQNNQRVVDFLAKHKEKIIVEVSESDADLSNQLDFY